MKGTSNIQHPTSNVQLEFTAARGGATQNQRLRDHFLAHPNRWLPMPELARVITPTGVGAAVHSRITDCRQQFGMTIHWKKVGRNESYYLYEPETNQ